MFLQINISSHIPIYCVKHTPLLKLQFARDKVNQEWSFHLLCAVIPSGGWIIIHHKHKCNHPTDANGISKEIQMKFFEKCDLNSFTCWVRVGLASLPAFDCLSPAWRRHLNSPNWFMFINHAFCIPRSVWGLMLRAFYSRVRDCVGR